jgi:hypothetical protein
VVQRSHHGQVEAPSARRPPPLGVTALAVPHRWAAAQKDSGAPRLPLTSRIPSDRDRFILLQQSAS